MNAIDISGINQLAAINEKVSANAKLTKAEFIAFAAALASDFYDGHRECEGDLEAKALLSSFSDCCDMASEISS